MEALQFNQVYSSEVTQKAEKMVHECLSDDTEYNERTQPSLSVKQALHSTCDAFTRLETKYHIPHEETIRFYYEVYRNLMLCELYSLSHFRISFEKKERPSLRD